LHSGRHRIALVIVAVTTAALAASFTVMVTPSAARNVAGASAAGCDWPMWGYGVDRTFATPCPTKISPDTAGDLKRIWFFNTHDVVTSTPAVVGSTAYVGDWSGRFYALKLSNGRPRWTFKIDPHPNVYAGQIVSSAAVAKVGGQPTVFFGGGKTLYALRARDGKLRWKRELGKKGNKADPTEIETSPAVVDGMVIVGWDVHNSRSGEPAGVVAFDAKTGKQRWKTNTAPTDGEGATGSGCGDVWSSPSVDVERRMVFVGTGNCVTSPKGWGRFADAIVALDLDDGSVRWTYQPHEPNNDDFDFAGAPNLFEAGGKALVGLGNKDAAYYAVDRETGTLVWSTTVTEPGLTRPGSNFSTGGFIAPTAVADNVVTGGTAIGGTPALHGLDATTGKIVWQQPEAAATYGAPAVANGVMFIGGTDFTMRAIDVRTGDILWSEEVSGAVSGGPVVVGDDVIAVAGIREPGTPKRSRTSGVYRFSLHGKPVASTTTQPKRPRRTTPRTTAPGSGTQECVAAPCNVPFSLIQPPAGVTPSMTLSVSLDPWRVEVKTQGLGPAAAWLRPGTSAQRAGATRYGVFISERDDNPQGGLLCVLDEQGSCTSKEIPREGATYNRITILAITGSDELPSPAEGVNRLVTTMAFNPPLAPV
jgi:polyvinyl alcohol dehydrogenase (cytochrome)